MINQHPVDKIIQTAMRYGADFAEVFIEQKRSTTITLDNRKIENASSFFDHGIGIRVISEGRTAYGATNDLSKKALLEMAKSVGKAVRAKNADVKKITLVEMAPESPSMVKHHPSGVKLEEKCEIVKRANETAWSAGTAICQVKITYRDAVRRILIASSSGTYAIDEQVGTALLVQTVAADKEVLQTGYEVIGGSLGFETFDETMPEEIAERAAKRALRNLKARPAPAGKMPVIIAGEAGGTMIHEAVGHGLEADLALDGNSVYSGKIGEQVASPLVTVIDDSTLQGKRGTFTFDDEGTCAKRTVLIEKGILKNYMSDNIRAQRSKSVSTGNARRESYRVPPIVRMTNTIIAPGYDDAAAILRDTESGLFVKRMGGGQVNTINGDFVFDVQEGYLIEEGKLGDQVRGATLIGSGPKILMEIDRIANDLGFSIGTCGKSGQEAPVSCGQPTLRIPEIVVGGM